VRIVLGYEGLVGLGGTEAYMVLLAERLEGLGHEALIVVRRTGQAADRARKLAVTVVDDPEGLPDHVDAVIANDAASAYELADRYPQAVRLFVVHSMDGEFQAPPPGVPQAIVTLNDRVSAWVAARPHGAERVRLRQPVDLERFAPLRPARQRALRLCAFGNHHHGSQLAAIVACCDELGLELDHVGHYGRPTPFPEQALQHADVVVGIGRCALEGMATGAATYVLGPVGADGWVTPSSYEVLEADGFSGRATDVIAGRERLLADLRSWTPELGEEAHRLARAGHDATEHARAIVELLQRLGAPSAPPDGAGELARVVRAATRAEEVRLGLSLALQNERLERERAAARAAQLQARYERVVSSQRWRAVQLAFRPLDRARRALRARRTSA